MRRTSHLLALATGLLLVLASTAGLGNGEHGSAY